MNLEGSALPLTSAHWVCSPGPALLGTGLGAGWWLIDICQGGGGWPAVGSRSRDRAQVWEKAPSHQTSPVLLPSWRP